MTSKNRESQKITSAFVLETERLILRRFVYEDLSDLAKLMANKDYMAYSVWGSIDVEGTKIFLKKTIEDYKKLGFGKWAIVDKETEKLIGNCGLHKVNIGDSEENIELTYRLDKNSRGKGLGSEAALAVRDYAISTLWLSEIVSCIDEKNITSICVAKKLGMKFWKDGKIFGQPCKIYKLEK